jgi:hypothetical protein
MPEKGMLTVQRREKTTSVEALPQSKGAKLETSDCMSESRRATQTVINDSVEKILNLKVPKKRIIPLKDQNIINRDTDLFLRKIDHPHMETIPLTSQLRANIIIHSTKKKKELVDLCHRLKNNERDIIRSLYLLIQIALENWADYMLIRATSTWLGNIMLTAGQSI